MRFGIILPLVLAPTLAQAQTPPPGPPSAAELEKMRAEMAAYQAKPDTPGTGAYPALKEEAAGLPEHTVYRPADLARIPARTLGIVAWGNGGCAPDGAAQRFHLLEIASHGYLVVAPGRIASGPNSTPPARPPQDGSTPPGQLRADTTAADVWAGVEWAKAENARRGSPLFGKIDPAKIAVSGYSCGGLQALQLAARPEVRAVVIHNSGIFGENTQPMAGISVNKGMLRALHTPIIYIDGGPSDIAYANGMDDFRRIDHVPAAMVNQDTGHGGTFLQANGGPAARVAVAWLDWQLRDDKAARAMFVGPNCTLCTDSYWTVERKNFPVK